jgi:hypothetical protein
MKKARCITNLHSIRQVLNFVSTELPKMFEFQTANVFWTDYDKKNLYTSAVTHLDGISFEEQFAFSKEQIMEVPNTIGVTGFAHTDESLCYSNASMTEKPSIYQYKGIVIDPTF